MMTKRCFVHACLTAMVVWLSLWLPGQGHAGSEQEISHLMAYIHSSDCTFIRNDKAYDALRAREHIRTKYQAAKRWIKSTEDFIELTATKSSVSGRPYFVQCGDLEIPCAEWLKAELARYRESR